MILRQDNGTGVVSGRNSLRLQHISKKDLAILMEVYQNQSHLSEDTYFTEMNLHLYQHQNKLMRSMALI